MNTYTDAKEIFNSRDAPYPEHIPNGMCRSCDLPTNIVGNRELFRIKSVWYLDVFPDELVIQEKTVSVIRRKFLYSYVETLAIRDIGEVEVTLVPIFAALALLSKPPAYSLRINNLIKHEAEEARNVVESLILKYQ